MVWRPKHGTELGGSLDVTPRVSMGRGESSQLETQVSLWARSPRQAWDWDVLVDNGPEVCVSVRGVEGRAEGAGCQPGLLVI